MGRHGILLSCLLASVGAAAWADGETRPATPAENAFSLQILTALAQSLPAPPPGFEVRNATRVQPCGSVSPGTEHAPMQITFTANWTNPAVAAQERTQKNTAAAQAGASLRNSPALARQKELLAQRQKLSRDYAKALQNHDQAQAAEAKKQMDALEVEMTAVSREIDDLLKGAGGPRAQKSQLAIGMVVNVFGESQLASFVKDFKAVSGDPGFALHDPSGKFEDKVTVLVGPWARHDNGTMANYVATPKPGASYTKAQAIKVTVTGDRALAEQVLAAVNWGILHAQVK
jgi:hypothetical protein